MEKSGILTAAWILGVMIVVSFILTWIIMPATPVIPKCPDCNCPEPVVTSNTVTVEVETEVPVDFKQQVVDALLSEVEKDKSFRKCGNTRFDAEEITVKRVYDGFVLTEDNEGELSTSGVKIKLNYDDGKCYRTFTCGLDSEQEISC